MTAAIKKHAGHTLNQIGQQRALDAIRQRGKSLPCKVLKKKGSIVQVGFNIDSEFTIPNITIPHFGPDYIRYPTQPGDLGITVPSDVQMGSVTGMGGGTPDLTTPGNLTALFFMPVAHKDWFDVDPNLLFLHGPGGVQLQDTAGTCSLKVIAGNLVITVGGTAYTFTAQQMTTTADVVAQGHHLATHTHTAPSGGGTTSPPNG